MSSKNLLIIVVLILALVGAFVLGRIDFSKEANMANNSQSSPSSSSLIASVISSQSVAKSSVSSNSKNSSTVESQGPVSSLKVYTTEYYPKLKLKYDSNKWKLSDNSKDYTDMDKKVYASGQANLALENNNTILDLKLNPSFAGDFAGQLPCYKEYKELSNGLVRFKSNFDEKENSFWFYVYKPWGNGFTKKGLPDFEKVKNNQNSVFKIEDRTDVIACGYKLIDIQTKTTLPGFFIETEQRIPDKGSMNLIIKGNPEESTLKEIDQIVENMEF
jgi:hypothetical protein